MGMRCSSTNLYRTPVQTHAFTPSFVVVNLYCNSAAKDLHCYFSRVVGMCALLLVFPLSFTPSHAKTGAVCLHCGDRAFRDYLYDHMGVFKSKWRMC